MDFLTELYAGLRSGAMNILRMWTIIRAMLIVISFSMTAPSFAVMQALDDQTLSQETGQAAFYTAYTAPSGAANSATDFGFFTLGLNGTMELNANIQHLQLGCGGINGPGCDIDMNNVSLSGNPANNPACGSANVAGCDAVLTNPFIRLAIKNPTTLSTRSLAGFQLGAANVLGLLQAGTNTNYANGINALSGYMQVQSDATSSTLRGTVSTAAAYFPVYQQSAGLGNYQINGTLKGDMCMPWWLGGACGTLATAQFHLSSGGFYIPGFTGLKFSVPAPVVNGTRLAGITVTPTVGLPNVSVGYTPDNNDCGTGSSACNGSAPPQNSTWAAGANCGTATASGSCGSYPATGGMVGTQGGPVTATVDSCSGVGCIAVSNGSSYITHLYGSVANISANVSFLQPLGFVHSIPINSPLSLSLQSTNVLWPGSPTADVAQPGWWMSITNPVILGDLQPSSAVSLCPVPANPSQCVFPQFAAQFNKFLASNTLHSADIIALISGGQIGVNFGTLALTPINLGLNGVQLSSQGTVPNCYGSLKFCFLIPILGWRRVLRKKVIRRSNV